MFDILRKKIKEIFTNQHINLPTTLKQDQKEQAVYKSFIDYVWSGKENFYIPTTINYSTKKSVFEEYLENVKKSNESRKELIGFDKKIEEISENSLLQQNKILGFSIAFLIVLIVIKILYVLTETIYNSIVLDGIASPDLTVAQLENIEFLGHVVSSVGFIILILPLLYKLSYYFTLKDIKGGFLRLVFMSILAFFLFLITFRVFEIIMDTLVERVSEQRYDAYYITMLKQGILNDVLSYSTLIDPESSSEERPQYQNFSTEDKVILLNLYLLLFSEENVVDKMINRGIDNIYKLKLANFIKEDYPEKEANVLRLAKRVRFFWKKYNELKEEANKKISGIKNEETILNVYQEFMKGLSTDYTVYQLKQERIAHKISFSLKGTSSKDSKKIKEEWLQSAGDISMHLDTYEEYLNDFKVKQQIIEKAKKRLGISLGYEFNYTLESFTEYYLNSYDDVKETIVRNSVTNALKRFGIKQVDLNLSWEEFVTQPFIITLLEKRISDAEVREHVIKLVKERNVAHFYDHVYLPKIEQMLQQSIYISKEDFNTTKQELGNMAIKSLYIPPVAIAFSSLFGLLNFVILIVMSIFVVVWYLKIRTLPASIKNIVSIKFTILASKVLLIAVLVSFPFVINKDAFAEYPVIEKIKKSEHDLAVEGFLNSLHVLLTYEQYVYATGKKLRGYLDSATLEQYGIKPLKERDK